LAANFPAFNRCPRQWQLVNEQGSWWLIVKWLNRERLTIYPRIFLVLYMLLATALGISAMRSKTGLTDFLDRPLGVDFSQFWVASSLALEGKQASIYNLPQFLAAQENIFQVKCPFPWVYPPTGLLLVLPLALLPYLASLGMWLAVTITPYLAVLRRIAPNPLTMWLALAFPGTFENFFHGQNGFLVAALVGWGLVLVDRAPLAGGMLLGLASFKPHLMILAPLALLAGGRFKALAGLIISATVLAAASYLVLGGEVWLAFWHNRMLPLELVATGEMPVQKMITPFAAVVMAGGGLAAGFALQAVVMAAVAFLVILVWRQGGPLVWRGSALALGMLLFTPHAFPYDLTLLALPLAWLGWEAQGQEWRPLDLGLLVLAWFLPLVSVMLSNLRLQLAPVLLAALLAVVVKKARREARQSNFSTA
jgi:alpha-1,2-mannosyltransferase